jgi:dihydrofolate reductase
MRKVKYFVANSLDNFIARPDGAVEWLFNDGTDYGMREFFASIDTMLMGRKTYEFALAHSPKPKGSTKKTKPRRASNPAMRSYVFSRTLQAEEGAEMEIVSKDAGAFVRNLKTEEGKDIWLMGGGELARSLFAENVVDEISLNVHPILLGAGIPLFPDIGRQIDLELLECKAHRNGCVQLTYRVQN